MTSQEAASTPRLLAVHAHPDDETLFNGLLLTKAARMGADVHVLTCTMGEEGEVIGEKYQNLVDPDQNPRGTGMLGGYRISELREALAALGVNELGANNGTPHGPHFLGGVGRWRDSGMAGTPSIAREDAFSNPDREANRQEQIDQLIAVIEHIQPDVVATYGPDGGYGHPDHIRAHQITHAAVEQMAAANNPAAPKQIIWCVTEKQRVDEVLATARGSEAPAGWRWPEEGDIAAVDSSDVDFVVHGTERDVAAKQAAMRAHATQIWVADGSSSDVNPESRDHEPVLYALSNLIAQPLLDTESYTVGYTAGGVDDNYAATAWS